MHTTEIWLHWRCYILPRIYLLLLPNSTVAPENSSYLRVPPIVPVFYYLGILFHSHTCIYPFPLSIAFLPNYYTCIIPHHYTCIFTPVLHLQFYPLLSLAFYLTITPAFLPLPPLHLQFCSILSLAFYLTITRAFLPHHYTCNFTPPAVYQRYYSILCVCLCRVVINVYTH